MSEQLTDEEEAEIIANAQKIAKKKRSNLYNEDGVAYAPWMVNRQVDEDAIGGGARDAAATRSGGSASPSRRSRARSTSWTRRPSSPLDFLGLKAKVLRRGQIRGGGALCAATNRRPARHRRDACVTAWRHLDAANPDSKAPTPG